MASVGKKTALIFPLGGDDEDVVTSLPPVLVPPIIIGDPVGPENSIPGGTPGQTTGIPLDQYPCFETFFATAVKLPVETRLKTPLPLNLVMLERWRQRLLAIVITSSEPVVQIRQLLLLAHSTELNALFKDTLGAPLSILGVRICNKRRVIEVDADFTRAATYALTALQELEQLGTASRFTMMLQQYLQSNSFNHRVSGACACVLLAGILVLDAGE